MHSCDFIIFSLLLLCIETTIANQLVAVEGGDVKQCLDKERHALLLFKAGLQDPNGRLSMWIPEEGDCCTWPGVTCNNQTGHVTELNIQFYGVVGEINHSLLNLTYLNHLDLSDNSFHGPIPTFIGSMTRLNRLDLGFNKLNGTIPSSIGSLNELKYLHLSGNSLYGTIPPEFGNLTKLEELDLGAVGRCRVENIDWLSSLSLLEELVMVGISLAKANRWVNVISSLPKLSSLSLDGCELPQVMYPYSSSSLNFSSSIEELYLGNNNLNSSMYRWLFPLTNNKLRHLGLSSNMLDGIPKYLGDLCSLEKLLFFNNSDVVYFPDFLNNLSGCTSLALQELSATGSQLTGSLSDEIQNFSSIKGLYLSNNHLNGTVSEKLWELPKLRYIVISSNYLRGSISKTIGKSKAVVIDLSENSLQGVPSTDQMSNLSYIQYFDMRSCKLGPHFPKWIQTLKNLTDLDISNNGISDTIPMGFWPFQLQYLNLSFNNIRGKAPDLSSNFRLNSVIDLSSNGFYGPIPKVSSSLRSLNLSKNKFSGGISFLCQLVDGFLRFLDLSHNNLTGHLPDCLWHFKVLQVLNLGHNNLYGRIPLSVGSLIKLEVLYLYNNNFFGELPLSLKNCTSLNSLNLGANKFFGNVPVWIGENLSDLYVLIVRSNKFFGTIPPELCQLTNLHVLDLSINNLHGNIPSCLSNLTSIVQQGFSQEHDAEYDQNHVDAGYSFIAETPYVDHAMIVWQGYEREFFSNMRFLKSIDMSSNNLTGKIPFEITNLYGVLALNVSKNAMVGEIPPKIGQMKNMLTLDLSRNHFSGGIPTSMSQMTLLNDLDLSFNNLSGRIPSSTQLQSFEPSKYDGNLGLCGAPLTKKCPGDDTEVPPLVGDSEGGGEDKDELWGWFYIGGTTGFVTGFWIACGTLLLNRRGRHAFF